MHRKGNQKQNEKTPHRMGENICKWCDWQRISIQILQVAHTAQHHKNKQPNKEKEIGIPK